MARKVLTDKTLKALRPAPVGKRVDVMDAVVPGFGVRVTDKADEKGRAAQRTFILTARYPGSSNPTRRAIGEVGAVTLERARDTARDWLALIHQGVDPGEQLKRTRGAELLKRENTFGAVTEEFIKRHVAGQRRAIVTEREIRAELLPRWKDRPLEDISRRDVVAMVDEIVDRGAKRQAHNILGHARTIFNWAINRGVYGLDQSPCDRLRPSAVIGPKEARQRVLIDDEIRRVWKAAEQLGYPYGPLVRLLILTGQRKAEVSEARWSEFDLQKKVWTIPPERFKSDAVHMVPLSGGALQVVEELPRFKDGDHLFSTTFGKSPVNGFSKAKARLDSILAADGSMEPWVLHDLRRTMRTRLSSLRVSEPVAEMVIGHARKGLARVYDQHRYLDEMREAFDLWDGLLRDLVEPVPKNVVRIKASK